MIASQKDVGQAYTFFLIFNRIDLPVTGVSPYCSVSRSVKCRTRFDNTTESDSQRDIPEKKLSRKEMLKCPQSRSYMEKISWYIFDESIG